MSLRNQTIKLLLMLALLCPLNTYAGIYKCKESDGSITYSQAPCANNEDTVELKQFAATERNDSSDCTYVNKFAQTTARSMKKGVSSSEQFNKYGGLDSQSKGTINLINYVYTHRTNENVSIQRIAALTEAKCSNGALGDVACEQLPLNYTDSLGGCEDDSENEYTEEPSLAIQSPNNQIAEQATQRVNQSNRLSAVPPSLNTQENNRQCKKRIQTQIDRLDEQMRNGYNSSQGNEFRERRRNLRSQMSRC